MRWFANLGRSGTKEGVELLEFEGKVYDKFVRRVCLGRSGDHSVVEALVQTKCKKVATQAGIRGYRWPSGTSAEAAGSRMSYGTWDLLYRIWKRAVELDENARVRSETRIGDALGELLLFLMGVGSDTMTEDPQA